MILEQYKFGWGEQPQRCRGRATVDRHARPGIRGAPLFQAAFANFNPFGGETKVDSENPNRGPLLIIAGEKDNTVPLAITQASFKIQSKNTGVTEIAEIPGRGHSLIIDSGWREVADTALAFVEAHLPTD